jgi:hypothetical protein
LWAPSQQGWPQLSLLEMFEAATATVFDGRSEKCAA